MLHVLFLIVFKCCVLLTGMGVSGVEGVFRVTCDKTMQVLRDNQDTIVTLLDVLLYDPLYAWTITANKTQPDNEGTTSD